MPDAYDPSPWLLVSETEPQSPLGLYWVWRKGRETAILAALFSEPSKWCCVVTKESIPNITHFVPISRPKPPTT